MEVAVAYDDWRVRDKVSRGPGTKRVEFVSVRDLCRRSATVWRSLAREKDLVVTSNGEPVAVLSATTASTLEASLAALRQARAQLAVAAMQQRARESGVDRLTLEDVNTEVDAVRRNRINVDRDDGVARRDEEGVTE